MSDMLEQIEVVGGILSGELSFFVYLFVGGSFAVVLTINLYICRVVLNG